DFAAIQGAARVDFTDELVEFTEDPDDNPQGWKLQLDREIKSFIARRYSQTVWGIPREVEEWARQLSGYLRSSLFALGVNPSQLTDGEPESEVAIEARRLLWPGCPRPTQEDSRALNQAIASVALLDSFANEVRQHAREKKLSGWGKELRQALFLGQIFIRCNP